MQNLSSQPLHSQSPSQSLPFQFASPSLSATLSIFISISLLVPLNRHLHLCYTLNFHLHLSFGSSQSSSPSLLSYCRSFQIRPSDFFDLSNSAGVKALELRIG
ncbi:hypothetical protein Csa_017817 [Cucumis sativus]|nr:hypothetical protein Csa_017817 [Cucumis sativus]